MIALYSIVVSMTASLAVDLGSIPNAGHFMF